MIEIRDKFGQRVNKNENCSLRAIRDYITKGREGKNYRRIKFFPVGVGLAYSSIYGRHKLIITFSDGSRAVAEFADWDVMCKTVDRWRSLEDVTISHYTIGVTTRA